MLQPRQNEISHRTIKLLIGVMALSLAGLTSVLSPVPLASISESYYVGGLAHDVFIGFLFAIAAFLMAYNGQTQREALFSKTASVAAMGVALFPCQCGNHVLAIPHVHGAAAALMFTVLALFCGIFYQRAMQKGYAQARRRALIYALSGIAIVAAMLLIGANQFTGGSLQQQWPRWVFYWEAVGLIAFGISWLTASHILPGITREDERFHPLS